jgi:hypothetical protein
VPRLTAGISFGPTGDDELGGSAQLLIDVYQSGGG